MRGNTCANNISGGNGGEDWRRRPGAGEGKSKGERENRQDIQFDGCSPCGYFLAGRCEWRGCTRQHSVDYGLAIRHEWLNAGCSSAQAALRAEAEKVLGHDEIMWAKLFPRVFSQRLSQASAAPTPKGKGKGKAPTSQVRRSNEASGTVIPRYLLVFDLEGKHEIIEFPVIVLDTVSRQEIGRFQSFVRPTGEHPEVRQFKGLEAQPESPAVSFTKVLIEFDTWLQATIGRSVNSQWQDAAFLSCGDFDCRKIYDQCYYSEISTPLAFCQWVNIKRTYEWIYGGTYNGMKTMLSQLRLLDRSGNPMYGFHHLGMHDVENICRCALHLLEEGHQISINGRLSQGRRWTQPVRVPQKPSEPSKLPEPPEPKPVSTLTSTENEFLKATKKVREILTIEKKMSEGAHVDRKQVEKVEKRGMYVEELAKLEQELPPQSDVRAKCRDVLEICFPCDDKAGNPRVERGGKSGGLRKYEARLRKREG